MDDGFLFMSSPDTALFLDEAMAVRMAPTLGRPSSVCGGRGCANDSLLASNV